MIKVGIIGMGIRGSMYANTIEYNPFAEVVGIVEADGSRRKDAEKQFKVNAYETMENLCDDHDIDLMIIALPDHVHREAVLFSASRACHMLIEKPLATSAQDARVMLDAIRKAGVKSLVAFENRWSPVFISAKEAVEADELGDVLFINTCLNDSIVVPTEMLGWLAKSSPAWFLFPHTVDMTLWLTGKTVSSVYARGTKKVLVERGIDTYDSISAVLNFADGSTATHNTCWVYPESIPLVYDFRFDIVGSRGAIAVDLRDQMIHKMTASYTHPPVLGRYIYGKPVGFAAEMLNSFIDDIRLDREPLVAIDDGVEVVEIIDAIHRSVEEGTVIEIKH
jgi:predicted dehydrogenase